MVSETIKYFSGHEFSDVLHIIRLTNYDGISTRFYFGFVSKYSCMYINYGREAYKDRNRNDNLSFTNII